MRELLRHFICLITIFILSTNAVVSQSRPGRAGAHKKKKVTPIIVVAEKEWLAFIVRLRAAFAANDYFAVRSLMAKDARCGSWVEDSDADGDLRDECVADWRITDGFNGSHIRWIEVAPFLSNKPCRIEKIKKGGFLGNYYGGYGRGINQDGECNNFESYFGYFVFHGGKWQMVDLGEHESE